MACRKTRHGSVFLPAPQVTARTKEQGRNRRAIWPHAPYRDFLRRRLSIRRLAAVLPQCAPGLSAAPLRIAFLGERNGALAGVFGGHHRPRDLALLLPRLGLRPVARALDDLLRGLQ